MKNKKLKLALHELEQEMEVIRNEELICYKGGSGDDYFYSDGGYPNNNGGMNMGKTDCVFQLMAHLSSGNYSAEYYKNKYDEKYRCSSTGDCASNGFTSDPNFNKLDTFFNEYFEVKEFYSPEEAMSEGYKVGLIIDTDGDGKGDHAVLFQMHIKDKVHCYDPQNNMYYVIEDNEIKHYIYVREKQ